MKSIDSKVVLKTAFCESGERSSIEDAASDDAVNFATGFPAIFSKALKDGGKHIQRKDFNGILYQLSVLINQLVAGGCMFYDSTVQSRIGGYPKNAVVLVKDGVKTKILVSNKDDNTDSSATTNIGDGAKPWTLLRTYTQIDTTMSPSSLEPVANKVVNAAIDSVNNNAVHKTDAETIAGVKTFSSSPLVPEAGEGDDSTKVASTSWVRKLFAKITAASLGALPTAGGTMTGTILSSTNNTLRRNVDNGFLQIAAGTTAEYGALLQLAGKDFAGAEVVQGGFEIQCAKKDNRTCALQGTPDGGLTWQVGASNKKNIVRSVNSQNADASGNVVLTGANITGLTNESRVEIFKNDNGYNPDATKSITLSQAYTNFKYLLVYTSPSNKAYISSKFFDVAAMIYAFDKEMGFQFNVTEGNYIDLSKTSTATELKVTTANCYLYKIIGIK